MGDPNERRRERRGEGLPGKELSAVTVPVARLSDVDRIHGRLREHDSELSSMKTRIFAIEGRVLAIESSLQDISMDVHQLMVTSNKIEMAVTHNTQIIQSVSDGFMRHSAQEMDHQRHQTKAIHALSRWVIGVFTAVVALVITLAGVYEYLTGESLLGGLMAIFGDLF
jgi:hypothetical protein